MSVAAASLLVCLGFGAGSSSGSPADLKAKYKRPDFVPFPTSNPYTPEKAALGKMLYFDPRVSGADNMNCASCHNPSFGWEAPVPLAIGAQNTKLGRHASTVLNMAWGGGAYFWDGRAPTLEEQAKGPIEADVEMNMPLPVLVRKLGAVPEYKAWFARVFPGQGITADTIAAAIAIYERTVVSSYAPFDAWVDGGERAISDAAKRGFEIFNGEGPSSCRSSAWRRACSPPGRSRAASSNRSMRSVR